MDERDDGVAGAYASPPCFLHEVDPAYAGLTQPAGSGAWRDVARWRRVTRERLVAERLAMAREDRDGRMVNIARHLEQVIGPVDGLIVGVYWPFRGEPDLRDLMRAIHERGGRCALPVVVARDRPLVFRSWSPGAALARGVWNIPIPAEGEEVTPDLVIAPVVGFDRQCYRLGHGGGFYDRTLAAMHPRPRIVGVGYAEAALRTIYPQLHDVPMDLIVTEQGPIRPRCQETEE